MDINQKYKRSSKIEAVIKHVEEVVNLKEKCVIFSQWVSMLDLVEFDLKQSGIGFTVNLSSVTASNSLLCIEARWKFESKEKNRSS